MNIKEFKCPNCGSEAKFVFWIKNNFVEIDSKFKIVQSNQTGYPVDKILNKDEIETLISLCDKEGNEILSDCKKCDNDKTIEVVFENDENVDGMAKKVLIEMMKHVNSSENNSNTTGTTMTDYEREVEKLKKWIDGLKPKTVKAGRKAEKISIEDFQKKLCAAVPEDERDEDVANCFWPDVISSLKFSNQTLQKDLGKVQFDTENCDVDFDIHDGVAFASCRAGGDWEMPLRFFVYSDGKTIRGYIPTEGNFFNKLCNIAFGSEGGEGGGEPADPNLPIMKKIEEMKNNCNDGSYPNFDDFCTTTEIKILQLAGVYHLTKKQDLDWNEYPDGLADEHFFEPRGEAEFFVRLGLSPRN